MKWSAKDLGYVKRWYRQRATAAIAERLGRTPGQVSQAAWRMGLSRPRPVMTLRIERTIRSMNARGCSDVEIHAQLGGSISRATIRAWRRHLGLPSQACSDRQRRRVARKTREQLRRAGLQSLALLRLARWREQARRLGWPEDLQLQEAIRGAVGTEDVKAIVAGIVARAKQGDLKAADFLFKLLGQGMPQTLVQKNYYYPGKRQGRKGLKGSARSEAVSDIEARLRIQQPASLRAIAGDLGRDAGEVRELLESDARFQRCRGGWQLARDGDED